VCLIRETKNTRSVGVPPGTGLGNTGIEGLNENSNEHMREDVIQNLGTITPEFAFTMG